MDEDPTDDRPLRAAVLDGWQCRCPNCKKAPLLLGYLKVRETCANCGEDFRAQRADDGPAYLTILIVGHLMAPLMMFVYSTWQPQPWVLASVMMTFCVVLSLVLLPRMKGIMVAIQWSRRMHGFSRQPVRNEMD